MNRFFTLTAFWEGVSFLVLLLIAMPLKYIFHYPMAVSVVGMAHGVLTVLYIWFAFQLFQQRTFTFSRFALAILMMFIPAGTFWFVKKYPV